MRKQQLKRDDTGFTGVYLVLFHLSNFCFLSVSDLANINIFLHCQGVWRNAELCCCVFVVLRDDCARCLCVNKIWKFNCLTTPPSGRQVKSRDIATLMWRISRSPNKAAGWMNHRRQRQQWRVFFGPFLTTSSLIVDPVNQLAGDCKLFMTAIYGYWLNPYTFFYSGLFGWWYIYPCSGLPSPRNLRLVAEAGRSEELAEPVWTNTRLDWATCVWVFLRMTMSFTSSDTFVLTRGCLTF